jgi:hypothetical protein
MVYRLVIEATTVLIEGTLDGDAAGRAGGYENHCDGFGPGGGQARPSGDASNAGAGGGGYGGAGGRGGNGDSGSHPRGWAGGGAYGSPDDPTSAPLGSGGGCNDDAAGGDGGGSITLRAETINIAPTGMVSVAGHRGENSKSDYFCFCGSGGAGGGGGGSLVLDATAGVAIDGILLATGGWGGPASPTPTTSVAAVAAVAVASKSTAR